MSKVVIIGSGLGGLSCGYILQKNGYDVTILEQGIQLGGCLQCFVRKGAKFETGMHFIGSALPGQTMDRMFNFLDGVPGSGEVNPCSLEWCCCQNIHGGACWVVCSGFQPLAAVGGRGGGLHEASLSRPLCQAVAPAA